MIKYFRNIEGKFFNILVYYIIGPALVLLLLYDLINEPSGLFDITRVRGHYQTTLIMGIIGLLLTIRGIIRLVKKD